MADFTFAHREEGFDEHIDWSIRGYNDLLDDVVTFSRYFVENESDVVDIGCSTGKVTERMIKMNNDFAKDVHWQGVEIAEGFFEEIHVEHSGYHMYVESIDIKKTNFTAF